MSKWDKYEASNFENNTQAPMGSSDSGGSQFLEKLKDALGGAAVGIAQGGSDIGANIAQFPSDIYSWATGKPGYTAPKPDLRSFAPQSQLGQQFETGGEFAAPFLSPALMAETMLGKAMFGGRLLPRLIADTLGGAAESEDRKLGAAFGAATPAVGKAIRFAKETPFTERGATQKLEKAKKLAGEESLGIPLDLEFLRNLEYQLGSPHLKPSKMQVNTLLGKAAEGNYPSYFALQSALGDISRELTHPAAQRSKGLLGLIASRLSQPQTTAAERLTGQQLDQLRKSYIENTMAHLNKTGKGKIAELETKGRKDYSNYKKIIPYRNKALIGALALATGIPGIRHLINE